MALQTLSVPPAFDLPEPEQPMATLCASARMEFQAALQLLADRAAFLTAATGVAIALEDEGPLRYRVATGNDIPEPETDVNANDDSIQRCLRKGVPVQTSEKDFGFRLLAPIRRSERAIGFMQVVSAFKLPENDVDTIGRLAELAGVALEHLQAAESADAHFWESLQEPVAPKQWHAPQHMISGKSAVSEVAPVPSAEVHLCAGCGFPVSPLRKLCIECEQKPDTAIAPSTELFAAHHQPSWFAEHGYTVASLIVSALAAAVIFWLRR